MRAPQPDTQSRWQALQRLLGMIIILTIFFVLSGTYFFTHLHLLPTSPLRTPTPRVQTPTSHKQPPTPRIQAPAARRPGWALIWSDEFNRAAGTLPDPRKWTPDVGGGGWGNNQLEYDTNNQNAHQDGEGNLVIEARKENPHGYQCWYGPCQYTSALLTTRKHFSFTYGRIEARIKIPSGQGMWAAFWLLGKDVSWPLSGEIDVMENVGWEPKTIHGVVHGPGYLGSDGVGGTSTLSDNNFADDYHTFMVQWESSRISFFADGNNYFTADRASVQRRGPWAFDHPFFIILNVAVGGVWSGNPDNSTVFPQRMSVDYVRVYRHTG